MLRAISEIAAEITVASPCEKPISSASARPSWRAATMSRSASIAMRRLAPTGPARRCMLIQEQEAFLEIERRRDGGEREAELHHRERHLGLDPDDHRLRTAELDHVRQRADRADRERIHHVERG